MNATSFFILNSLRLIDYCDSVWISRWHSNYLGVVYRLAPGRSDPLLAHAVVSGWLLPRHLHILRKRMYIYMYMCMDTYTQEKWGPPLAIRLTATSSPSNTRIRMYIWMYVYVHIWTEKVGPCICTCQRAHCSFVACPYTITYVSVWIRIHTYLNRYERKCTCNSKPLIFSSICIHIHVHVYVHTHTYVGRWRGNSKKNEALYVHIRACECGQLAMHGYSCAQTHTHIRVYICIHMYTHTSMYISNNIPININTYQGQKNEDICRP